MANFIHKKALIGDGVVLGDNNHIGPYCCIKNAVIGDGNTFDAFVSVGAPPQHRSAKANGPVVIGNNNVFREFVTVHSPTERETRIADDCYLMSYAHVSHDSHLEPSVTMANASQLGGHTYVMRGATIGLGALIHQRQVIGAYCMIGMGAIIPKGLDVVPGRIYAGNPAKFIKMNLLGLERGLIDGEALEILKGRYMILRGLE